MSSAEKEDTILHYLTAGLTLACLISLLMWSHIKLYVVGKDNNNYINFPPECKSGHILKLVCAEDGE